MHISQKNKKPVDLAESHGSINIVEYLSKRLNTELINVYYLDYYFSILIGIFMNLQVTDTNSEVQKQKFVSFIISYMIEYVYHIYIIY